MARTSLPPPLLTCSFSASGTASSNLEHEEDGRRGRETFRECRTCLARGLHLGPKPKPQAASGGSLTTHPPLIPLIGLNAKLREVVNRKLWALTLRVRPERVLKRLCGQQVAADLRGSSRRRQRSVEHATQSGEHLRSRARAGTREQAQTLLLAQMCARGACVPKKLMGWRLHSCEARQGTGRPKAGFSIPPPSPACLSASSPGPPAAVAATSSRGGARCTSR